MQKFLEQLRQQIDIVEGIANKIELKKQYMNDIRAYLPLLNQSITELFRLSQDPESFLELNQEFVLQILNDILYGIENEDMVLLLDVLRYGLLQVFYYALAEWQGEN